MGFLLKIYLKLERSRLCMLPSHHAKTSVWNGSISTPLDFVVWVLRRLVGHWALRRVSTERCASCNSNKVILHCTAKNGRESAPTCAFRVDRVGIHPLRHTLTCRLLHCAQPFRDFLCPTRGALFTLLLSMVNQSGAIANIIKHEKAARQQSVLTIADLQPKERMYSR